MMQALLIGIGRDGMGEIAPVFVTTAEPLDALQYHKAVVAAACRSAFLPVSFGTSLGQDRTALMERITARKTGFETALSYAETHVEIGVRLHHAVPVIQDIGRRTSGRTYLQSSARRASLQQLQIEALNTLLESWKDQPGVVDLRVVDTSASLTRVALLVSRVAGARVSVAIEAASNPDLSIEVSGPWPLYSFGVEQVLA